MKSKNACLFLPFNTKKINTEKKYPFFLYFIYQYNLCVVPHDYKYERKHMNLESNDGDTSCVTRNTKIVKKKMNPKKEDYNIIFIYEEGFNY